MKQITISLDITPLAAMFGNDIIIGEDVNRLLIDNLSLPDINKCVNIFFDAYDIDVANVDNFFHFITVMKKVLLRSAPLEIRTILTSVEVVGTSRIGNTLLMEINYNYE